MEQEEFAYCLADDAYSELNWNEKTQQTAEITFRSIRSDVHKLLEKYPGLLLLDMD